MAAAPMSAGSLEIAGAMLTDIGRVRASNEDAVAYVIPSQNDPAAEKGCLLLVADGMGGHAAGEVASALAVEAVRRVYYSLEGPVPEVLMAAFEAANRAIFEYGEREPHCRGMGTTCTALAIRDNKLWLAHVGDSRAYLLRGGKLTLLSEDQTLQAQMIREGLMTEEEARAAGGSNVILNALGTGPDVFPAVWETGIPLAEGDILILCSDGLWNMLDDAAIAAITSHAAPQEACRALLDAALDAGGYDNVSVGVFAVRAAAETAVGTQKTTRPIAIPGFKPEARTAAALTLNVFGEGAS